MKVAVIDYGVGNLHSVAKALERCGATVILSRNEKDILGADKVVLPGVGAFGDCMKNIERYGIGDFLPRIVEMQKPLLGICVGMQVLFEESEESYGVKGLGIFQGRVQKIVAPGLKIPHIGWNKLLLEKKNSLLDDQARDYVYFVHSYHCVPENRELVIASVEYGEMLVAAVQYENIQAVQFHPEKSGAVGLRILSSFVQK